MREIESKGYEIRKMGGHIVCGLAVKGEDALDCILGESRSLRRCLSRKLQLYDVFCMVYSDSCWSKYRSKQDS